MVVFSLDLPEPALITRDEFAILVFVNLLQANIPLILMCCKLSNIPLDTAYYFNNTCLYYTCFICNLANKYIIFLETGK